MTNSKETRFLKRTILIGLGGTGKEALLRAKQKYIETFGEVPPLVKFLLIDTTPAVTDRLRAATPNSESKEVRLRPDEVLYIEARGASLLPKVNDEIREWFPPEADLKANIISGAGQIRALGRLALFANARSVYDCLRELVSDACNYKTERVSKDWRYVYEPFSPHLTVCVVASLAGGTGSGIFLDVAMILRDMLKDEEQLFAYLLLPDIYVNRPGTQNVEANAYAAFKELDYHMSLQETYHYTFGGRDIEVRKKPFDMVFLVNRENRTPKTFNEISDMAELLGLSVFFMSGPLGKEQADVFDNIVMQLAEQQGSYYGRKAHYASIGVAELQFRPERLRGEAKGQIAQKLVKLLLAQDRPWQPHELVGALGVVESAQKPTLPPGERPRVSNSRDEDLEYFNLARQKLDGHIEDLRVRGIELLRQQSDISNVLQGTLEKAFKSHALNELLTGLGTLSEAISARLGEISQERHKAEADQKEQYERLQRQLSLKGARWAKTVGENLKWVFGRNADEEPRFDRNQLGSMISTAERLAWARARESWLKDVDTLVKQKTEDLRNAVRALGEWVHQYEREADKEQGPSTTTDDLPFTVTLPPPYLETVFTTEANEHHYLEALRRSALSDLLEDAKACLTKVCEQYEALRLSEWLNDVAKKPHNDPVRSAVERCLHELDKLAAPAWDYQDAWVSNPRVAEREQVNILGLENGTDDESPLLPGRALSHVFAGNIQQRNKLKVVRTGQPDRVYLYKIEASIPAFVLRYIEMYRERYEVLRTTRSLHIDRRWEPKLPPLDPLPTESEAASVWVKARLFGLVRQQGAYQCVRETTNGQERWHELGPTLGRAFEAFARNFTLFRELQYRVSEKERTWLQERRSDYCRGVDQALQERRDRLNVLETQLPANGDRENSERQQDRKVVQLELEALEKLRLELGTVREEVEDRFPTLS
jgi:hypothetical protein